MTSSSLRKPRITQRSTSTCGNRVAWLALGCGLLLGLPTLQAAPPAGQPGPDAGVRKLRSFSTLPTLQRPNAAAPAAGVAAAGQASSSGQMSQPTRSSATTGNSRASRVTVAQYDSAVPADYVASAADASFPPKAPPADAPARRRTSEIRTVAADDDDLGLTPEPDAEVVPEGPSRRFKRIDEILPYYDYSRDKANRRCDNLCPRPEGVDCPDCIRDSEEYTSESCPECPNEIRLVDVDPHASQVAASGNRAFLPVQYEWEASNLYHLPIYFEDFCLERYGHTRHHLIQPFVSTGLFATQLLGIPYQMTIDPICKKRYVLGWHRPGDCVPYRYHQIPWNTEAAIVEAGFVTGGYFLFAPGVSP